MERESVHRERRLPAKIAAALLSFLLVGLPASGQNPDDKPKDKEDKQKTESPIKHVIVLIGENRTFDHLFATYVPQSSDTVSNLLSKGIIKADGTPGPNFSQAAQFQAVPPLKTDFFINLDKNEKAPYSILPQPTLNFAPHKNGHSGRHPDKRPGSHRAVSGSHRRISAHHRRRVWFSANHRLARPRYPYRQLQRAAERTFPAQRKSPSLRFLHWRHHPSSFRDVATIGLRRQECHAQQPFRLLKRPLSLRNHQLHEYSRSREQRCD
jgi:hypothetical protein